MSVKKLAWVTLSCLIVLVTALTSCTKTTTTQTTAKTTEEAPKYGGTVNMIWNTDVRSFDDAFNMRSQTVAGLLSMEDLWEGDWARGPAGTGEVSWSITGFEGYEKFAKGRVAESWEITGANKDTLVIHVRKGIFFHNKPPTNGRELTADDVAFSINRQFTTPTAFLGQAFVHPISVTKTDQWTVEVKYNSTADLLSEKKEIFNFMFIWPKDAVEANKNDMRDWRVNVGSGPFMITDYVKNSVITLSKFSNYWDKDPVGPGKGNKLPYVDEVKILIIQDISTQQAAMRTGKGDQCAFTWDMAESIKKTNPELMSAKSVGVAQATGWVIKLRMNDTSLPWSNIKVRQALHMSINYQSIADSYYGGNATVYSFPAAALPESKDFFVPINQLPQNVQDIFKYQPDKAKQMIIDAGYPNGFDLEVICRAADVDLLSIYKNDWAKIGVNLKIDAKEAGVYTSVAAERSAKHALFAYANMNIPFYFQDFSGDQDGNMFINDTRVNQAVTDINNAALDFNKQCQIYKTITPYLLEQAWIIPTPAYYQYNIWQPWLKNYHGELSVGNVERFLWAKWIWVDQDLKTKTLAPK